MGFFSRLFRRSNDPDDSDAFLKWAIERGLDPVTASILNAVATSPEDAQAAYEARQIRPPFDTRADMRAMNDDDLCGVSNLEHGLLFVGASPNGDPIAVDIADDQGSVWYVSHEEMHSEPLRSVSVRVASSLLDFVMAMTDEDETSAFAIDYFDAKRRNWIAPQMDQDE